ncbi:unnamed protein product [Effrenium voratum]|uniref:Cytochrome b5 heme-binding domain-containing protein n=1 Tax=Effrenium voratum TaxID=2562239 RepID=A0AA36MNC7_9DINO|nr:unnamed protein product [Effrenium voratum]
MASDGADQVWRGNERDTLQAQVDEALEPLKSSMPFINASCSRCLRSCLPGEDAAFRGEASYESCTGRCGQKCVPHGLPELPDYFHEGISGPGNVTHWSGWILSLHQLRQQLKLGWSQESGEFSSPEFQRSSKAYVTVQTMVHDRNLYDPIRHDWTAAHYLKDLKSRFGGVDQVLLWAGYPNLGVDTRSNLDLMESVPGGMRTAVEVVIVGGGLAGLSAACELLERGCNIVILEKSQNLGGNSSKATTGIAAPGSELQKANGVTDNGADLVSMEPIAKDMIEKGAKDVDWLLSLAGCKDEMVLRLTPGHQKTPRTLGTRDHFPGAVVTYAVMHQLDTIAKAKPDKLKIVTSATVTKLVVEGSKVTGVEYQAGGAQKEMGVVLLATGGFAGDTSPASLLARYAPQLMQLPTTSDERTNGDGLSMATEVKAAVKNMNMVSVYPTAAVIPGMENDKFKIVLSDALVGAGGKLINYEGVQFVGELETAQKRADAMGRTKGPFRIVISEKDTEAVKWLCDFYVSRNVMKKYSNAAQLAAEMRVQPNKLPPLGTGAVLVAVVTPATYTCAGGLAVDQGKVLTSTGAPIEGLFAAGEVTACPCPNAWSASGVPLLYSIYTGRLAGASVGTALGAKEKVIDLVAIANALEEVKKEKKPEDMTKDELLAYCKELESRPAAGPAAPAGPPGVTLEEVAKHNKKDDAWVVVNGEAIDVTKWITIHPGGEQAIMAYLGKDATEEWNMIHKPGTVEKNAQHLKMMGKIGAGGAPAGGAAAAPVSDGMSPDEVAKHNTKTDAWIILHGEALDVTKWISIHPGGEQAIMAYLGKDATEEWVMIHKPGTVEKNMQHLKKMGKVSGAVAAAAPAAAVDDSPPPPDGDGGVPGFIGAVWFLLKNVMLMVMRTVFFTGNLKFSLDNNRNGTMRSAVFLITFTIVHALGNFVDMLGGPAELNGEGYLFDRIHWTGAFGYIKDFPFSVVEEYLALALLLHVTVALKRSYDITIGYTIATGRWNMLLSGLVILTFLIKHLQDFRFYPYYDYVELKAPPMLVNVKGVLSGHIFTDPDGELVKARDLYSREVALFKDLNTVLVYSICLALFVTHLCLGWKKLVPADAMQIPRDHQNMVIYMGWAAALAIAGMYGSVPWYVYFAKPEVVEHIKS